MRKRKGDPIDGVVLLDKSDGMSSNYALQGVKRLFNAQKAGHTGTLDPFATGLLVCCLGKATKICGAMLNVDKRYTATLCLGSETDSGDYTGLITQEVSSNVNKPTLDLIEAVVLKFKGEIEQVPPMYSALKKEGQPLYKLARQGIEVERAPRKIHIYEIHIISYDYPYLVLDVFCSKGTYIRTLAQDIGRELGNYAHLTALRRTEVGPFKLSNALNLEELKNTSSVLEHLITLEQLPEGLLPSKLKKEIE